MLLSDSFLSKCSAFTAADWAIELNVAVSGTTWGGGFWALELAFRPLTFLIVVGVELVLPEGLVVTDDDVVEEEEDDGGWAEDTVSGIL